MNEAQIELVTDILEKNCIDYEIYEDYSGRCMYGATTTGIVTRMCPMDFENMIKEEIVEMLLEDGEIHDWDIEGGEQYDEEWLDETVKEHEKYPNYRYDNMAMDMIYY